MKEVLYSVPASLFAPSPEASKPGELQQKNTVFVTRTTWFYRNWNRLKQERSQYEVPGASVGGKEQQHAGKAGAVPQSNGG